MFGIVKGTRSDLGGKLAAILAATAMSLVLALFAWAAAQETESDLTVPPLQLMVAESPDLGAHLTDSGGRAIYIFLDDRNGVSNCDMACTTAWPPVLVEAGADLSTLGLGIDASLLSTITLADGTEQLVYNGWPLYFYAADVGAGSTLGHGVGDVWFLATPEGAGLGIAAGDVGSGPAPQ